MKKKTLNVLKNLIGTVGMPFVSEALKDRETLEEWIIEYLNESLSRTDPLEFERAFENDVDLSENLDQNTLKNVKDFIRENQLDMREIHNSVRYHLPSFDKSWVMKWLAKDQPLLFERIVLHPQCNQFQAWLARNVRAVGNVISNTFRNY